MYFLSKFLPWFVLPLGISLMLMTWGILRQKKRPALLGLLILLLATQPSVARVLVRAAEGWAERPAVSSMQPVDAIVVLSAGRRVAPGPDQVSEWNDANRFFGGVELYTAGKAPRLVFTAAGGDRLGRTEGSVLAAAAQALGVPADVILVTGEVFNTADEARETMATLTAAGLTSPRILLVTSAFHMPRAHDVFTRAGFDVQPFPVDFTFGANRRLSALEVLPSVTALGQTHTALREFYGRAYYWLRSLSGPIT